MLVEITFVTFCDLDAWLKKIASEAYFPFVFSGTTCDEILSVLPQNAVEFANACKFPHGQDPPQIVIV